jgi:glycosyltransferase involved in cell wall biosynthesis
MALEYTPFAAVGLWSLVTGRRHAPRQYPPPRSVSVVIPALNEEKNIVQCIDSASQDGVGEILVVDGGSTDRTRALASARPHVRIVDSPRGRGTQVSRGIDSSSCDVVCVLHADCRLTSGSVARLLRSLAGAPDASGGALGARYDSARPKFRVVELLNNARARMAGVSFGDQAQFFRRRPVGSGFRDLALMEDVELSFVMRQHGTVVFVGGGVASSPRRWERVGYGVNFIKVAFITSLYIIRRRLGLLKGRCEDFYRMYYG